ncbi:hypothetical protein GKZ68_14980 [Hymenobacter sp. BRD128]|uniref:hypothetical protein n=1 Tax=Hymenobacter sp. BRD128 TaxID=2675878 RepID=UPI001565998F|nr:hypothetical protein [Hymenobacter sp. BRD128]QKG57814.1 hypothetical protein GKZ68_14980 [Hymenobacter sp. BRD128]
MKNLAYYGCFSILFALAVPGQAVAQVRVDSASVEAVATARQVYAHLVRPESVLFNGPEYVDYSKPGSIGHQFFLDATPQTGTIVYRQGAFENVLLRYDLLLDQVVLTYPGQTAVIKLVPEFISSFTLGNHQFARMRADSTTSRIMPTGFYEVLLPGPVSLLARHTKRVEQTYVQQNLRFEYRQADQLLLRTASSAAEVSSLKDLLALLPAHKAEAQRYARQHKLRFRAAQREASALEVLRYYYTLPQ